MNVNTWRALLAGTFMGFGAIIAAAANYGFFYTFFGFVDNSPQSGAIKSGETACQSHFERFSSSTMIEIAVSTMERPLQRVRMYVIAAKDRNEVSSAGGEVIQSVYTRYE